MLRAVIHACTVLTGTSGSFHLDACAIETVIEKSGLGNSVEVLGLPKDLGLLLQNLEFSERRVVFRVCLGLQDLSCSGVV